MQETGPTVYSPYPRRLECLTICWYNYKGSTFSSVILRPWVLVRSGTRTLDLPHSRLALYQLSWPGGKQLEFQYFRSSQESACYSCRFSVSDHFYLFIYLFLGWSPCIWKVLDEMASPVDKEKSVGNDDEAWRQEAAIWGKRRRHLQSHRAKRKLLVLVFVLVLGFQKRWGTWFVNGQEKEKKLYFQGTEDKREIEMSRT